MKLCLNLLYTEKSAAKKQKNLKNWLTSKANHCIIDEHEISDETECGYILTEIKGGGNFSGVCHGKDQAVSF